MEERFNKVKDYVITNKEEVAVTAITLAAYGVGILVGRLLSRETIEISGKVFQDGKIIEQAYVRTVK